MNVAPKAKDAFKQQEASYHPAPNFTSRPFPNGPYELGTLVEDIRVYYPINQGASNRVPIPDGRRYSDIKQGVNANIKTSRSGEASIIAKLLDHSIGGEANLKGQKSDDDVHKIEKLEITYFFPNRSYINKCLELTDVKEYLKMSDFGDPVYLITGLKIAWSATISTKYGRGFEGNASAGVTVPTRLVHAGVRVNSGVTGDSLASSSFDKPADFVLGIQVQKLYHKKAFLTGKQTLEVERVTKGAVLVDDDESEQKGDAEAEDNFVRASLNEADLQGLNSWTGEGSQETWILPSNIA